MLTPRQRHLAAGTARRHRRGEPSPSPSRSATPDRDVHRNDLAWWPAQEERMEIRAELASRGLL